MANGPITVLLAAASSTSREALRAVLEADRAVSVVAVAPSGRKALELLAQHRPRAMLLDIRGSGDDELAAIGGIMQMHPLPLVVCGDSRDFHATLLAIRALKAGAIACVDRPDCHTGREAAQRAARLLETLKLMSEVKVVRRSAPRTLPVPAPQPLPAARGPCNLVGIGASTGGPPVLHAILSALPAAFPVPILVVQHIARGFLPGLAQWLGESTPLHVQVASAGMLPLPGHVYLAPDDHHMALASNGLILLSRQPPEEYVRPAVSVLFRSLAQVHGARSVGVILTGMGRDGADGLARMKESGAVTIAQDEASSAVHGMPGAAIAAGAATHVLSADSIAQALVALCSRAQT